MFGRSYKQCPCQAAMSQGEIDLCLLNYPHKIIPYQDLTNFTIDDLKNFQNNIIFFGYPGQEGHWTCLLFYPESMLVRFFDPYGFSPDEEWPFLINPEHLKPPHKILSEEIIPELISNGWTVNINKNDIQGYFDKVARSHCSRELAENLCGELVVLRIIYRVLDDNQFATMIKQQTPTEIVEVIKNLLWPHGSITNPC